MAQASDFCNEIRVQIYEFGKAIVGAGLRCEKSLLKRRPATVGSRSVEANIVNFRHHGEQGNGIMFEMGICPDDVPGIDLAGHLASEHPGKIAPAPVELLLLFSVGGERRIIADGPIDLLPPVLPHSPAPAHRTVDEVCVKRVGARGSDGIVETAYGEDSMLI